MQSTNEYVTDFDHLHLRIEEILQDRGISKTEGLQRAGHSTYKFQQILSEQTDTMGLAVFM